MARLARWPVRKSRPAPGERVAIGACRVCVFEGCLSDQHSRSWSGPSRPSVRRRNAATGSGRASMASAITPSSLVELMPASRLAASTNAGGARKLTCSVLSPSRRPARLASSRTDASIGVGVVRAPAMAPSPSTMCAEYESLSHIASAGLDRAAYPFKCCAAMNSTVRSSIPVTTICVPMHSSKNATSRVSTRAPPLPSRRNTASE